MSLLRFLLLMTAYRNGEHFTRKLFKNKVIYRQAKEVVVSSKNLINLSLDGEILPGSVFNIKILPKAVTLRLPQINQQ